MQHIFQSNILCIIRELHTYYKHIFTLYSQYVFSNVVKHEDVWKRGISKRVQHLVYSTRKKIKIECILSLLEKKIRTLEVLSAKDLNNYHTSYI